ncbi:hypothetical protein Hte_003752 [Hypoxylon texense]
MPTIPQAKRKTAQPSKPQILIPRPSVSGSKPSAPAQSRKPTTTATSSHHTSTSEQPHHSRPLSAAAILSNPRLRQVTGLHPRKAMWWNGLQPPPEELARLQWALNLPDAYPVKRPKGNYQAIDHKRRPQH